ncbi:MAG: hypothetical protein PUB19_03830 [Lachnospiraceae bacterium]|nr:hypothetical protein [Lachnospiraceae bacterium]
MTYKIGEFTFENVDEAKAAEKEAKAIAYITKQMKTEDPESVFALYCQMLEKDLFHTKLGISFLDEIYQTLIREKSLAGKHIPPVPGKPVPKSTKRSVALEKELKRYKRLTRILSVVCITMGLIIVGMFVVNATSQHPTILNYEQKIIDKYAGWEQELNQREENLVKREQQLGQ